MGCGLYCTVSPLIGRTVTRDTVAPSVRCNVVADGGSDVDGASDEGGSRSGVELCDGPVDASDGWDVFVLAPALPLSSNTHMCQSTVSARRSSTTWREFSRSKPSSSARWLMTDNVDYVKSPDQKLFKSRSVEQGRPDAAQSCWHRQLLTVSRGPKRYPRDQHQAHGRRRRDGARPSHTA